MIIFGNMATTQDLINEAFRLAMMHVYPVHILSQERNLYHLQPALDDVKEAKEPVKEAVNKCKSFFEGQNTGLLSKCASSKLSSLSGYKCDCPPIKNLLDNTPIYLVTHDLCGTETINDEIIPSDTYLARSITWEQFKDMAEKENMNLYRELPYYKGVTLGMYEKDHFDIRSVNDISKHTRIYLWVDHIMEAAEEYALTPESLFTYVLIHELTHAFMDTYTEASIRTDFYEFKEESLATGLALYLCSCIESFDKTDLMKMVQNNGFIENQPIPYQVGLNYMSEDILAEAVPTWMEIKAGEYCPQESSINHWFRIISNKPLIDKKLIVEAEHYL